MLLNPLADLKGGSVFSLKFLVKWATLRSVFFGLRLEAAATARQPRMREDLPQPEMPVSTVRRARGKRVSIPLRLFAVQPLRRSQPDFALGLGRGRRGGASVEC